MWFPDATNGQPASIAMHSRNFTESKMQFCAKLIDPASIVNDFFSVDLSASEAEAGGARMANFLRLLFSWSEPLISCSVPSWGLQWVIILLQRGSGREFHGDKSGFMSKFPEQTAIWRSEEASVVRVMQTCIKLHGASNANGFSQATSYISAIICNCPLDEVKDCESGHQGELSYRYCDVDGRIPRWIHDWQ